MKLPLLLILSPLAILLGCDREDRAAPPPTAAPSATATTRPPTASAAATRTAALPRIVFLGDSITAGLGLDVEQAFPAVVGQMLQGEGLPVHVVNAGVSGDTTAGGVRRIDWLLRQSPDVVVVGLGGNDGLRGVELRASEENLRTIVRKARQAGARVLLLGMLIPPNYGPEYATQFRDLYPRVARELDVPLVPFVLEGVGGDPRLNQPDGIHPTAEGQRIVARNLLPHLRSIVREQIGDKNAPAHPTN